ncbi:hypothetical protein K435DRAFT_802152 [Dendrothele bispora CBS 962.96]|uniref:Uncharacterized protein n=1 Tax=Dendrothele bispora (strain CBS 962.96) TaxID=1314807 RepID=A0A4S8LLW8_DENBC|nr:hypothetical protein K435DRAFT_802152 [Dendrothele bispora CBS 962.96]
MSIDSQPNNSPMGGTDIFSFTTPSSTQSQDRSSTLYFRTFNVEVTTHLDPLCNYQKNQIIGRVSSQSSSASQTGTTPESPAIASTTIPDGPIPSDASSKSSHTAVIAGSVTIAGTFVILTILLLLWRYRKSRLHLQFTSVLKDNGEASKKATHEVEPYDLKHMSICYASQVHPHPVINGNEVLNSPRNSVNSTIVTTSVLTKRQIQLRDETEALRDQIKILQQAVLSSNVELQREIARMGAHMQRLESMWNSDWARGISDDPPPHYES